MAPHDRLHVLFRPFTVIPARLSRSRLAATTLAALACVVLAAGCVSARATTRGEAERIAGLLDLRAGMHLADVGAGKGKWTEALAGYVEPGGKVYATEVDEGDIEPIHERLQDAGIDHVEVVLGDQQDTGLPENCCDAILVRLVYHHFQDPAAMRASLRRAMRPAALLMIVDITIQSHWGVLDGVPDRGGHGIMPEDLLAEMTGDGFEVVERFDDWDGDEDHFCVIFRRSERVETAGTVLRW